MGNVKWKRRYVLISEDLEADGEMARLRSRGMPGFWN